MFVRKDWINTKKKKTIEDGGGLRNYDFATQSVADNYLKARKKPTLDSVLNTKKIRFYFRN